MAKKSGNDITINVKTKVDKSSTESTKKQLADALDSVTKKTAQSSTTSYNDQKFMEHVTSLQGKILQDIYKSISASFPQIEKSFDQMADKMPKADATAVMKLRDQAAALKDKIFKFQQQFINKAMDSGIASPNYEADFNAMVKQLPAGLSDLVKKTGGLSNPVFKNFFSGVGRYLETLQPSNTEFMRQLFVYGQGNRGVQLESYINTFARSYQDTFKLEETIAKKGKGGVPDAQKAKAKQLIESVRGELERIRARMWDGFFDAVQTDLKDTRTLNAAVNELRTQDARTAMMAENIKRIKGGLKPLSTKTSQAWLDQWNSQRTLLAGAITVDDLSVAPQTRLPKKETLTGKSTTLSETEIKGREATIKEYENAIRQTRQNADALRRANKEWNKLSAALSDPEAKKQLVTAAKYVHDEKSDTTLREAVERLKVSKGVAGEARTADWTKAITGVKNELTSRLKQLDEARRLINNASAAVEQKIAASGGGRGGGRTTGGGTTGGGGGEADKKRIQFFDPSYMSKTVDQVRNLEKSYSDVSRVFKDGPTWERFKEQFKIPAADEKAVKNILMERGRELERALDKQKSTRTITNDIAKIEERIVATLKEAVMYQKEIERLSKSKRSGLTTEEKTTAINALTQKRESMLKSIGVTTTEAEPALQDRLNKQFAESRTRILEATEAIRLIRAEKQRLKTDTTLTKDEIKAMTTALNTMEKGYVNVQQGMGRTGGAFKKLGDGMKGVVTTMMEMAKWQSVWYLSKGTVFAIPQLLSQGIEYAKMIDEMRFKLTRWGATSGEVTAKMKSDVESLGKSIRQTLLTVPGDFKETLTTSESLVGAGMNLSEVQKLMPTLAIMKSSFPEVDFEKFAIASMGAFNVFKDGITEASDDAGKFKILMEQLLRAQAESIARPEHFTKIMQYMSEMGKIAGMTAGEVFALSTTIADTGVTTSQSSRLLSGFITQLSRPKTMEGFNKIFSVNNVSKDNILSEDQPLFENLKRTMRGLREMGFTEKAQPTGVFSFLQTLVPKEEIKVFGALVDRYEDFIKRIESLKVTGGSIETLIKQKQDTIQGQTMLLKHTLNEISLAGSLTAQGYGMLIAGGLDAARGALLALNPEIAKGSIEFENLGTAGRLSFNSIKATAEVVTQLAKILAPFLQILGSTIEYLSRFSILIKGLTFLGIISALGKLTGSFTLAGLAAATMGKQVQQAAVTAQKSSVILDASGKSITSAASGGGTRAAFLSTGTGNANRIGGTVAAVGMAGSLLSSQIEDEDIAKITAEVSNLALILGLLTPAMVSLGEKVIPALKTAILGLGNAGAVATGFISALSAALGGLAAYGIVEGITWLIGETETQVSDRLDKLVAAMEAVPGRVQSSAALLQQAASEYATGFLTAVTVDRLVAAGLGEVAANPEKIEKLIGQMAARSAEGYQAGGQVADKGWKLPGKPAVSTKKIGIPDADKKGRASQAANLEKEIRNIELDILKTHLGMIKALYTEFYNWGYMTNAEFYREEKENLRATYDAEYKVIMEGFEKIKKERNNDRANAKKGKKDEADVDKNFNLQAQKDALDHKNKLIKLTADMLKQELNLFKSYHKTKIDLIDEANKQEMAKRQHMFNMAKADEEQSRSMVMMEADYKRSMFQITETEYYRLKREQIDETAKREIEAAELAFNKFMAENDTKIKAIEDQTGSTKEYLRLLDLMKEARQSDLTPERYNEVKKAIDDVVTAMEGENKALLDELGLKKMIGDLDKARYDRIEAVTAATNKQAQAQKEQNIANRTNAQLKKETEGWISVFKLGTDETTAEYGKWGDNIQLMTKQMYSGLDSTFKNIFSGSFKGELDSAEEYFIAFCESIYNSLTELLSKQFVSGISGLISSFIGGGQSSVTSSGGFSGGGFSFLGGTAGIANLLTSHSGGYIMHLGGFVPRFHSGGLNADEVPAILQKGEYVVSKRGVNALDRLNNGELVGGPPKININIIDNNKSHVTAETSSSGSNIDLNMIIDQAVAKNLAKSGSASNKTLKQGFGARERLVRR